MVQAECAESLVDTFEALAPAGVVGLIYDWSPVPFSHEPSRFVLPDVIETIGMAGALVDDWCRGGLYRVDPVQRCAANLIRPFYWSYHPGESTPISARLEDEGVKDVASRLLDWNLARGMTLPLHHRRGGFATVTAFLGGRDVTPDIMQLALFTLKAHEIHDSMSHPVPCAGDLTGRESECLQLTAEGLSSKQIAFELGRSESMVVKHIHSATHKLGARNRAHAVALAARYGWLS